MCVPVGSIKNQESQGIEPWTIACSRIATGKFSLTYGILASEHRLLSWLESLLVESNAEFLTVRDDGQKSARRRLNSIADQASVNTERAILFYIA
jgi:hypothetical protein